jgi:hypothetical protein
MQEGQVCDRCRQKKIKCDGVSEAHIPCSNCSSAGVNCEVTVKLRRKTRSRGFSERNDIQTSLDKLEKENSRLRRRLQVSSDSSMFLQQRNDRVNRQIVTSASSAGARNGNDTTGDAQELSNQKSPPLANLLHSSSNTWVGWYTIKQMLVALQALRPASTLWLQWSRCIVVPDHISKLFPRSVFDFISMSYQILGARTDPSPSVELRKFLLLSLSGRSHTI